jgi:CRISPR-associated endonuclease/helicase Cas3
LQKDINLHDPNVFDRYFNMLWQDCQLDVNSIVSLRRRLDFKEVASRFKLIDQETVPVITGYDESKTNEILNNARWRKAVTRDEWRVLQAYSVSIYHHELDRYRRQGFIQEILPGLIVWSGIYDSRYGLSEELIDSADLVQ